MASDAGDPKVQPSSRPLPGLVVSLIEALLFGLVLLASGGLAVAIILVSEDLMQDATWAVIIFAVLMLLFLPAMSLAQRLSSKIVSALLPNSVRAPTSWVEVTDDAIVSRKRGGRAESVLWRDLLAVHIINEDGWPVGHQFWLLVGRNRTGAVVPSDAAGAADLLAEMQKRLPGFDNRTVVVAMGSISGSFQVWPAAGGEEGAG